MNEKFIIRGAKPLKGEIEVRGAKNAATPILAACLLTNEPCEIDNLPLIEDVFRMIEVLESMGVLIEWLDERKLGVCAKNVDPAKIKREIVSKMRSSILLLGALSGRFEDFEIPQPGGCVIGARTTDAHTEGLASLGVVIEPSGRSYRLKREELKGCHIIMKEVSVTATENIILASVLARGKTTIHCAAAEPHVQDLCRFLNKMGADISGIGSHTLSINGMKKLKGTTHRLIYDPIEAGTFLSLAAATKGKVVVRNVIPQYLKLELLKFKEAGANFKILAGKNSFNGEDWRLADIEVCPCPALKSVKKVHNMPYPGFAADLLPPFAAMLTQAEGTSLVHDWMYEGRLNYVNDLNKMGANAVVCDPHRVLISGPTALRGTQIKSYDLRAGATLIIAALIAEGESEISDIYQVDRGYERIEERLQGLGAEIRRI